MCTDSARSRYAPVTGTLRRGHDSPDLHDGARRRRGFRACGCRADSRANAHARCRLRATVGLHRPRSGRPEYRVGAAADRPVFHSRGALERADPGTGAAHADGGRRLRLDHRRRDQRRLLQHALGHPLRCGSARRLAAKGNGRRPLRFRLRCGGQSARRPGHAVRLLAGNRHVPADGVERPAGKVRHDALHARVGIRDAGRDRRGHRDRSRAVPARAAEPHPLGAGRPNGLGGQAGDSA